MLYRVISKAAVVAALYVFLTSAISQADLRPYLATYGYYTPEKGEVEIEQWTDSFVPRGGGTAYRSKTELEYGVTDRLAAALYFVNTKPAGGSLSYDKTKLELRYRLNDPGVFFWDMAGYLEIVRPDNSNKPYEMEMKAILSHEFPNYNLTLNLTGEKALAGGRKIEPSYALGIAPHRNSRFKGSLELFGGDGKHYIMPALWLRPGKKQSIGIGLATGLTKSSDRVQLRTIYVIEF